MCNIIVERNYGRNMDEKRFKIAVLAVTCKRLKGKAFECFRSGVMFTAFDNYSLMGT
jgi:hypothetical protein